MMIISGYSHTVAKNGIDSASALNNRGAFLLSQLGYHVATRCAELLQPLGLQPAHYGVLTHLARQQGLSQQQLADAMGVHRNNMVGLIDELEERALVRRDRDPHDRRAHQLHLTDDAHGVLAQADGAVDQLEDEIFAGLNSDEHSRLVGVLQRAARQAGLPDSVHPGLRRRRRTI
jgi:DNA-binding MarR family transcriptional regulator